MLDFLNRNCHAPADGREARQPAPRIPPPTRRTQFDPPESILRPATRAAAGILQHAYDTVPYYRAPWRKAGVHPSDVKSLADLEALPVLTKADIRTARARTALDSAFGRRETCA